VGLDIDMILNQVQDDDEIRDGEKNRIGFFDML